MSERFSEQKRWGAGITGARLRIVLLIALGILCGASAASAGDVYVAQSSAGGSNGSSCANARAVGSLGGSDWSAGNTIHLCGNITSTVTAQGSGSSGAPITILFEPGATFTAPAISINGAIDISSQSNIIVDGGSTVACGYVSGANVACNNGSIKSTSNGTGLSNQVASVAILAQNTNNVEIRNLLIGPLYTHTSPSDGSALSPPGPLCVQFDGANNISIHNNTMHDAGWCLNGGGGPSTNLNIYNNEIYNIDHGVGIGNANTNINIYSNHFHDFANWDTTNNSFHHDGIHLFGVTGAIINGANEYNNLFDGAAGNNLTAYIYNEGLTQNIKMYNNVGLMPNWVSCCGVFDFFGNGYTGSNNSAYNNTVIGAYQSIQGSNGSCFQAQTQQNVTIENNVFMGCASPIGITSDVTIKVVDYNAYDDVATEQGIGNAGNTFGWHGSQFPSFTQWKSDCGCDSHSLFGVTSTFSLNSTTGRITSSSSPLVGAGLNLTSVGFTILDADFAGTPRPSGSTGWDMGAFELGGSGSSSQTQPAPPTNVKAVAQ